jgi:hypothetical protein
VQNPFVATERVKQFLNPAGEPFDQDDFDAQFVAQMNMRGGQDEIVVVVLGVGQLLAESGQVVVVDQRDSSNSLLIFLPFDLNEPFADHVSDELRAVAVPTLRLELVKLFEEGFFKRKAKPHEVGHAGNSTPRLGPVIAIRERLNNHLFRLLAVQTPQSQEPPFLPD